LHPVLEGVKGVRRVTGVTHPRDPPQPSLYREGFMSLGLGLRLLLSFKNSLENFFHPMMVYNPSDDVLKKIL